MEFTDDPATRVVVERYAGGRGREFTIIVLGTRDGPVPLIPTEVEISAPDEGEGESEDEKEVNVVNEVNNDGDVDETVAAVAAGEEVVDGEGGGV